VRCRAVLVEFLSRQIPGLWIPLAEVRAETGWPSDQTGVQRLSSIVARATREGLIEFKSGATCGRASVRLKVQESTEGTDVLDAPNDPLSKDSAQIRSGCLTHQPIGVSST